MKRSLPEMKKVFQYQYATDSAIDDMAEEEAEWKYLERYEFTWEAIVKQLCFFVREEQYGAYCETMESECP